MRTIDPKLRLGFWRRRRIDQLDPMLMPSAFERRFQPNLHNVQCRFQRHHSLAERNHVRVIVLPAKPRRIRVPTYRAANAFHAVRHNRLSVARAAQNNAALKLMPRHRLRYRPDEKWIIHGLFGMGPKIGDAMPAFLQKVSNLFFVKESSVVRTNCNFHERSPTNMTRESRLRQYRVPQT
jgi:hypothetical protein